MGGDKSRNGIHATFDVSNATAFGLYETTPISRHNPTRSVRVKG
jgi:hypothetical protein